MDYCKYHPDKPAVYECINCHIHVCDDCVDMTQRNSVPRCYLCESELHPILNSETITPFWRRLNESFRYPLEMDALMLIIGSAILFVITSYIPFSFLFHLMILGSLFKYGFSCLENTAKGRFKVPDITQAYGSGFNLILQVILIVVVVFSTIYATYNYAGSMLGSIVAVILISGLPAMIINFALTENIFEALNPLSMMRLMTSVGLPYGLLLAFILIMSGSVGVIHQLVYFTHFPFISSVLQSAVSNYYIVVIFQIMGYMIYQYQQELGFQTQFIPGLMQKNRTVLHKGFTRIDILVKEGKFDEAVAVFDHMLASYPDEETVNIKYLELLLAVRNSDKLQKVADDIITNILKVGKEHKITTVFQRIKAVSAAYNPGSAELRFKMAKIYFGNNQYKMVVSLLNDMYKKFKDSPLLGVSYILLADALDKIPDMHKQALQCRQFANKISRKMQ